MLNLLDALGSRPLTQAEMDNAIRAAGGEPVRVGSVPQGANTVNLSVVTAGVSTNVSIDKSGALIVDAGGNRTAKMLRRNGMIELTAFSGAQFVFSETSALASDIVKLEASGATLEQLGALLTAKANVLGKTRPHEVVRE